VRFTEGRAYIALCPLVRCEVPIIEAHAEGMTLRMSRWSVPYRDAMVLQRYERIVVNVWEGESQLYAVLWSYTSGKPDRGRLYARHICGIAVTLKGKYGI
jgi:hypothetical protein